MSTTDIQGTILRKSVHALLLILVVPLLSVAYFSYTLDYHDAAVARELHTSLQPHLTTTNLAKLDASLKARPFSQLDSKSREFISRAVASKMPLATDHAVLLTWSQRAAWWTLGLALAITALCLAVWPLSHAGPQLHYLALVCGWQTSKWATTVLFVLQMTLGLEGFYTLSSIYLHTEYTGLMMAPMCAIVPACLLARALLQKAPSALPVDGVVLSNDQAPDLMKRIQELASRIQSAAPERVVVGVDHHFFVTERPVEVRGQVLEGCTLFVSLPLLRLLERDEAEAVLAHELGHFAGEDTEFSKRIAPLLWSFDRYLAALKHTNLASPVHNFMLGYRGLVELSLRKNSRQRELMADRVAREVVSGDSAGRALIKVTAYARFRSWLENWLLSVEQELEYVPYAALLERHHKSFLRQGWTTELLARTVTPHPFDSHPPLHERLEALGVSFGQEQWRRILESPTWSSWATAIHQEARLEAALWAEFDEEMRHRHGVILAHRFLPETHDEASLVARYFPPQRWSSKSETLDLTFEALRVSSNTSNTVTTIPLYLIKGTYVEEDGLKRPIYLRVEYLTELDQPSQTLRLKMRRLPDFGRPFLKCLEGYLKRQRAAIVCHLEKQTDSEDRSLHTTEQGPLT